MCLIFHVWNEKWWKSLIPFYGTYLMYKHTWNQKGWIFFIPLSLSIIGTRCMSFIRKDIASNIISSFETYLETEQINVDVDSTQLMIYLVIFLISMPISFLFTRITYLKICNTLHIDNRLLKIGTFFFPQVFLLIDYIYYKKIHFKL